MSKIYQLPLAYRICKRYVTFTFRFFFREYIIVGRENLPKNVPLIFAPNHLCALMDALAVVSLIPQNKSITFLARSDIFKNRKIASILRFFKIMPAFRIRDGYKNLDKNNDVFDVCVEALEQKQYIGIMPEGNQGELRNLRPLVKGIFRVAFGAQQQLGPGNPVYIVPIGLDYGDLVKARKHLIITIGKPINVAGYLDRYNEQPAVATNEIREELRQKLHDITLDLATDQHYECFETATEVCDTAMTKKSGLQNTTIYRFVARREIASRLVDIEKNQPETMALLDEWCTRYRYLAALTGLRTHTLESAKPTLAALLVDGLIFLISFPPFIHGFLVNFLPFLLPVAIRKAMKVEYEGFFSSIQYVLGILFFPLFYILQTYIFYHLSGAYLPLTAVFFLSQFPLGKLSLYWYREFRKFIGRWNFYVSSVKKKGEMIEMQEIRNKIIAVIVR